MKISSQKDFIAPKKNFAFYVSGRASRLMKFLQSVPKEVIANIVVVVSDEVLESNVKSVLNKVGIPSKEIPYENISGKDRFERNRKLSNEILFILRTYEVSYCFSFGSHVLSGELLHEYKNRIINFHPSILPQFPGVRAIDQALASQNIFLVGNTAHFVDEGVDTGTIIMQTVIPLQNIFGDKINYDIVLDLQVDMLRKLIDVIQENRLIVKDDRVYILGANYSVSASFPVL